jgi:hypothetical protein
MFTVRVVSISRTTHPPATGVGDLVIPQLAIRSLSIKMAGVLASTILVP